MLSKNESSQDVSAQSSWGSWSRRWLSVAFCCALAVVGLGVSSPLSFANVPMPGEPSGGVKLAPATQAADTTRVEPGVVRIDTTLDFQSATGTGTGVVLSPDGIVLTNNHVIRGASHITATNIGNGQSYPADVLGYDRKSDIAVLALRGAARLPVAPTGDSASLGVGEPVTGLGFPGGGGLTGAPGTVRALNQSIVANDDLTGSSEQLTDLIDFDSDIRPGDSGGPLVNDSGEVVGIVTAASQNYRMQSSGGFAIPVDRALAIMNAIRSGNATGSIHVGPTAILGVGVTGDRDQAGVPVQSVLRGGPADRAGIAGGDVITGIDTTPTSDATELTDVLDGHSPGDTVILSYLDGQRNTKKTPLSLAPGPPN